MTEIPDLMVPFTFNMDPETDDLLYTRDLKNGMIVLSEDDGNRREVVVGIHESTMKQALKHNRWCRVTKLNKDVFIGEYCDGTKIRHMAGPTGAWYVKIDSIQEAENAAIAAQDPAQLEMVAGLLQKMMDRLMFGSENENVYLMAQEIVELFADDKPDEVVYTQTGEPFPGIGMVGEYVLNRGRRDETLGARVKGRPE